MATLQTPTGHAQQPVFDPAELDANGLAFPAAAGVEGGSASPTRSPVAAAIAAINSGAAMSPRKRLGDGGSGASSPAPASRRSSSRKLAWLNGGGDDDGVSHLAISQPDAQSAVMPEMLPQPSGFAKKLRQQAPGRAMSAWAVPKLGDGNPAAVWIEDPPSRAQVLKPILAAYLCTPTPTPPDERFDGLAKLLAAYFDMPIAMVLFMDDWYAYLTGTYGAVMEFSERRCNTLATWVLAGLRPGVVVIPDCTTDGRVKDYPLVAGPPKLRFFAAAPLVLPGGHRLGALCLLDHKRRAFEPQQAVALAHFAELAARDAVHAAAAAEAPQGPPSTPKKGQASDWGATTTNGTALVDVAEAGWSLLHISDAFAEVTGISARDGLLQDFWQLFRHFSGKQGQEAADACAQGVGRGTGFALEVQRSAADDASRYTARFMPATADRLDGEAAAVAVPGTSALHQGAESPTASPTPFYFVTLEAAPSLDGTSPAASPRSPHRSPRRSAGLQLNPAARGPPFGDSVVLGGLIGRGATSSVYAAQRNGKPVAVKVVEGEATHEALTAARERLESLMGSSLGHANLVSMVEIGTRHMPSKGVSRMSNGVLSPYASPVKTPRGSVGRLSAGSVGSLGSGIGGEHTAVRMQTWIVQELAALGSLQLAIDGGRFRTGERSLFRGGPDMAAVLAAAADIAAGMAYLHSKGVLHGALKPTNVLLSPQRQYQVSDYALGEVSSSGSTADRAAEVAYLPPEAVQGGSASRAADVYAFGVLLWQMYTSEQPFAGLTAEAVQDLKGKSPPWRLMFPPGAPPDFQVLAEACMAGEAAQRPTFDAITKQLAQLAVAQQAGTQPPPQPFAAYQRQLAAPQ